MSFLDILRTAFFALRGNWMRSALTSLGVIIGIAAVIVMVSIGQGTQAEIDKMVSGLGSQRLDIGGAGGMGPGGARIAQGSRWSLNDGDVEAIRNEIPEVQYAAGQLRGSTQVVYAENNASTSWQGVQADWFPINDWQVAKGEGFQAGVDPADEAVDRVRPLAERQAVADQEPQHRDDGEGRRRLGDDADDVLLPDHAAVEQRQARQGHQEDQGRGGQNPGRRRPVQHQRGLMGQQGRGRQGR